MELVDTHCHIDVGEFDADRPQVLQRCRERGIRRLVVPAVMAAGWEALLALCRSEPGLYPALGLHPVYLDLHQSKDLEALGEWLDRHDPVAVGEIGLDFYIEELDRERQQRLFEAQLSVARDAGKPVLLHVRKAHDAVIASLRRIRVPGGIVHAFNGSLPQARQYQDLGFGLGFGGTLTYPRSQRIRGLARELPLESIVLETDAPDMAVAAHRGERNSPEYLLDVLQALAEVRDQPPEEIATQTTANAERILGIDGNAHRQTEPATSGP
ncbi:MAG: TatD family hydrolase [Gammaproteobacteria bacterium]